MSTIGTPPPSSEITSESLYLRRREFIKNAALFTLTSTGVGSGLLYMMGGGRAESKSGNESPTADVASNPADGKLTIAKHDNLAGDEPPTPLDDVTTYNNFYEFGLDKGDPAANAHTLRPRPWTVAIEGEVAKPQVLDLDRLLGWFP
ncbi:MAG: mononuclear molybdenum enzyme YedY, partial [Candidatus Binatia bacterium]